MERLGRKGRTQPVHKVLELKLGAAMRLRNKTGGKDKGPLVTHVMLSAVKQCRR